MCYFSKVEHIVHYKGKSKRVKTNFREHTHTHANTHTHTHIDDDHIFFKSVNTQKSYELSSPTFFSNLSLLRVFPGEWNYAEKLLSSRSRCWYYNYNISIFFIFFNRPQRLGTCQRKQDEDDYGSGRQDDNITKNRYFNILPSESVHSTLNHLMSYFFHFQINILPNESVHPTLNVSFVSLPNQHFTQCVSPSHT